MRRIKLILGLVTTVVAMTALTATPAMAAVVHHGNNGFVFFNGNNGFFPNNNDFFFPNNFVSTPGVFQGISNESESGDVTPSFSVESTGNNSNQCVTPLQFGNTGNFNNAQGSLSFGNGFDNGFDNGFGFSPFFDGFGNSTELEGGQFDFSPVLNGGCTQQVQQSSAASS
jgi:hypothetical protein